MSFLFSWCWGPLHRGSRGPPRSGMAFPSTTRLQQSGIPLATASWTRTQLSKIIIQRPHDRPLDLWNRMFNRHQAEITVMQFRGHSLPVHQSVLAQCDLHLSHIISLNPPTRSLSISGHWNVSLPSGASPWNSMFLGRIEGQNITL